MAGSGDGSVLRKEMHSSFILCVSDPSAIRKVVFDKFTTQREHSRESGNQLQKNPLLRRDGIYKEIDRFKNIGFT